MELYRRVENIADSIFGRIGLVNNISVTYNIPRPFLSFCISVFILLFVFVGVGASLLSQLVGFLYPTYASFKAIESPTKEDDSLWLTYWIVFAVFSLLETFIDTVLWWFPLYYTFKILFLMWCQAPFTRGAETIYQRWLRPHFLAYQGTIDHYIASASTFGSQAAAVVTANANAVAGAAAAGGGGTTIARPAPIKANGVGKMQ